MSLHDYQPRTKLGEGLLSRETRDRLVVGRHDYATVERCVELYRNAMRGRIPGYDLTPDEQADVAHIKAELARGQG